MTKVWCNEASVRVTKNLDEIKNPTDLDNFKTMTKISEVKICFKFGICAQKSYCRKTTEGINKVGVQRRVFIFSLVLLNSKN